MSKLQTVKDVVTALKKGELTVTDQEAADELANCFQKIFTKDVNRFYQVEEDVNSCWLDTCTDFSPERDGLHPLLLRSCAIATAEP